MRVLVTGATGFLGGALVRGLAAEGREVVATGRDRARLAALAVRCVAADLSGDSGALRRMGPVDAVVHCAALSSPFGRRADFAAANVRGTAAALDVAAALGARRFVNISSPSVTFALRDQEGVAEDDPLPAPFNPYAATKAEAERLVAARPGVGPVTLRPRGIYGAGETTLLPRLLAAARRGPLPVFRGGAAAIDLTHVDDVVDAVRAALDAGPMAEGRVYHVSGGEVLPVAEIVERVCGALRVPVRWRAMPLRPVLAAARLAEAVGLLRGREPAVTRYGLALFAYRQSLALDRARDELGWVPRVRFAEGLARTVAP